MADRVAFIGGNTVNRDHFPFPVQNIGTETGGFYTGVGDGRFHPAILTVAEACRWCWLVKKWHLGVTFAYSVGYSGGALAGTGSLSFDYRHKWTPNSDNDNPPDNALPTRESDLVRARWGGVDPGLTILTLGFDNTVEFFADNGDFDISNVASAVSNDDGSGEDLLLLSFGHDVFSSRFASWSSGLVPKIFLELSTTEDTGTTGYLESAWYSSTSFPNALTSLTVDSGTGTSITAPMKSTGAGPGAPHYRELSSVTAAITAVEFWPYAARDNSPIYNTSTGAQLQSPFN